MSKITGEKYEDFKSEEYVPSLYESLISYFDENYKSKRSMAHDNINEIIESLPETAIARIGRVANAPYPLEKKEFTDIYRILNPKDNLR